MKISMQRDMQKREQGFIVGTLLVLIIITSVLLTTIVSSAVSNWQSATSENARINAQFTADAGIDQAIHEVNLDATWPGTGYTWDGTVWVGSPAEVELLNDGTKRTTYQIIITDGSATEKTVQSIGRTYQPVSATTPKATRTFELEIEEVTTGFGPGAVVSGVGGLNLDNNSKITGGDVIVNGSVSISNTAQIGLSTNPVNLRVAHQSCPSPANSAFPQVCTFGEPITNNGSIYGDVQAQNQTTSTGMSDPGLTSSVFPPIAVPGYDRASHKAASSPSGGYNPNSSPIKCSGGGSSKTASWPANAKISGDVTIDGKCIVTISGDVWITGDLSMGNKAEIHIDDSLGTTRPVIMIDGENGLSTGNNNVIEPNSSGTGAEVITTWWNTNTSTNGGFDCGGIADPLDCASVDGLALSTSQGQKTIDLSNGTDASNTIFRTLWSLAEVSNNGALGAVAGQTITLGENAVINFTAAIPGSDNLTATWVKRGYLRVFQ